jgi:glycine cleavage system H protein
MTTPEKIIYMVHRQNRMDMPMKKNPDNVTRREFLQKTGLLIGITAVASQAAACAATDSSTAPTGDTSPSTSTAVSVTTENTTAAPKANPEEYKFSVEHIWVSIESDNMARVGISHRLWNLVTNQGGVGYTYLTVKEAGSILERYRSFGSFESHKMSMDLVSPVSGEIAQTNDYLTHTNDVYGKGWIMLVRLSHPEELDSMMSWEEYSEYINQSTVVYTPQ